MTISKTKCVRALKALVCPSVSKLNWKVLALVLFLGATSSLSSCTAFEETYYEQADDGDGDLGPGCKLVNGIIICE